MPDENRIVMRNMGKFHVTEEKEFMSRTMVFHFHWETVFNLLKNDRFHAAMEEGSYLDLKPK